jgi:hypothetical protein
LASIPLTGVTPREEEAHVRHEEAHVRHEAARRISGKLRLSRPLTFPNRARIAKLASNADVADAIGLVKSSFSIKWEFLLRQFRSKINPPLLSQLDSTPEGLS